MLKTVILFLLFSGLPNHVSLMSVEYLDSKNAFEVFLKLDYDDFVTDYWYSINDDHVFDPSGKIDTTIVLLDKYLNDKVQIFADEKRLKGEITKLESVNGEVKLNILFNTNGAVKNLRVKSLILTNVYRDQSNLLIFRNKLFEEGIKLNPEKIEHSFILK
jgi:hypothetical protein